MNNPLAAESEFLVDLALTALDKGIGMVSTQNGKPILPFALLVMKDGTRGLSVFASDGDPILVAEKRIAEHATSGELRAYAYGCDSYVTFQGQRYDAIYLRACEQGRETGFILARRYLHQTDTNEFIAIGEPIYMGITPSLFAST